MSTDATSEQPITQRESSSHSYTDGANYVIRLQRCGFREVRRSLASDDVKAAADEALRVDAATRLDTDYFITTLDKPFAYQSFDEALLDPEGRAIYQADVNPKRARLIAIAHQLINKFFRLRRDFVVEADWTRGIIDLYEALCHSHPIISSEPETPTPRKMLESLGLLALNSYKPDLAMGLDRNAIDFRRDDNHFQGDICQYIASRGVQVYVGLNEMVLSTEHWFDFLLGEHKGNLGTLGRQQGQMYTAMIVSLKVQLHLAHLAASADPESFSEVTPTMRRVYGFGTMAGLWQLTMMVAEPSQETGLQRGPDIANFTLVDLWVGAAYESEPLLRLLSIFCNILQEVPERLDKIGNWLYCLRKSRPIVTSRRITKRKASDAGSEAQSNPRSSKAKRRNPRKSNLETNASQPATTGHVDILALFRARDRKVSTSERDKRSYIATWASSVASDSYDSCSLV